MSTRGVIARVRGDSWEGVYQHSDSYPTWLGKHLWGVLHQECGGNVETFLKEVVDDHLAGWSIFPDRCYCHWRGDTEPMIHTAEDTDHLFIEWVYAFSPRTLAIFGHESVTQARPGQSATYIEESRLRYMDGRMEVRPAHYYVHALVAVVPLDGEEPDWEALEKGWYAHRDAHESQ